MTALASTAIVLDLTQAASMINFGAFVAFIFVNASVLATYLRSVRERGLRAVVGWVLIPLFGVGINVYLWFSLDSTAKLFGCAWAALGLIFLLWRTRMFTTAAPSLH